MEYQKSPDVFTYEKGIKLSNIPNQGLLDEMKIQNKKNNQRLMTNIKK